MSSAWLRMLASLLVITLICLETAAATIELPQTSCWISAKAEPEAIRTAMGFPQCSVGGTSSNNKNSPSVDQAIVSDDSILHGCEYFSVCCRKNGWKAIDRMDSHAKISFISGTSCLEIGRPPAISRSDVEDIERGLFARVLEYYANADGLPFYHRGGQKSIYWPEPCPLLQPKSPVSFLKSKKLKEAYCHEGDAEFICCLECVKPSYRPAFFAEPSNDLPESNNYYQDGGYEPSIHSSNFFSYDGRLFNKEYVERGAVMVIGAIFIVLIIYATERS